MADLSGSFHRPFKQQVAAFRRRLGNLVPTERWDDIERSAHDRAFMVAGATKADLLADLAAAVDKSITEGASLEEFRRDFRAIVTKRGWHNWTGEGTKAGEAWRTRVIYRTNMATSYAAGRVAQLREGNFKFWIYFHGGSVEPRPQHLAWNGLVLPPDHPFWVTHGPPNGWGCSCYIVGARSEAAARRLGGDPDKPLPDGWQVRDPRTGAPPGIDRGWDYTPGASVSDEIRTMAEKSVVWPYELAKAFMVALPVDTRDRIGQAYRGLASTGNASRRFAQSVIRDGPAVVPPYRTLGLISSDDAALWADALGQPIAGYDYSIPAFAVQHIQRRHGVATIEAALGQRAVTVTDYSRLGEFLNAPGDWKVDGERLILRRIFGGEVWTAVFEVRRKRRMLALVTLWVRI